MSLTKVTLAQATVNAERVLKAGLVPYVAGSPGVGKSAMVREIARKNNLKVVDIRLSQEDPTTINGFPCLDGGRSNYLPPSRFPLQGKDDLPVNEETGKPYAGWLIFFDELPSAPRAVQAASYKIILDRMIDTYSLHDKAFVIAAGNLLTDNAIVNEMGSALKSRMVHIHVETHQDSYIDLAAHKLKFDTRIVSYLAYRKDNINNFDKFNSGNGSSDETFACERTWEFVSKILKANCPDQNSPIPNDMNTLLQGTVGSVALEFVQYTHAFKDLPSFVEILANPQGVSIPTQPAVKWLLMGMLVGNAEMDNVDKVVEFVERMEREFQFIFAKMLWGKSDEFLDNDSVARVFNNVADMLAS